MKHGRESAGHPLSLFALLAAIALALISAPAGAEAASPNIVLDWIPMAISLGGGLALFLFGMEQMSGALKAIAGSRMKLLLARLTTNRVKGAITGAFVTAVIQSSSVTTVLLVGFVSAGLMSLSQSVGVIMGANIGTTITAQIVAFKITKASLLFVGLGFGMSVLAEKRVIKKYGTVLMGLGLIFLGMSVMSDAMAPLRSYQPFLDVMTKMQNPLFGIVIAALFTALVQSSSATTGIVIVMASQGLITLPAGIALAFGANIGTCVTAILASLGRSREALRAAVVHVSFNVLGVLIWVLFIDDLAQWVVMLSPAQDSLSGTARQAAETPRQIANAHTIFNVANTVLLIGISTQFARFAEWLIPDRPLEKDLLIRARYLDDQLISTPDLAMDRARLEIGRLATRIQKMLVEIMPAVLEGSQELLNAVADEDEEVDVLYTQIIAYLGRISQEELTERQTEEIASLMSITNDFESLGDLIETDLVGLGLKRIDDNVTVSKETQKILMELHTGVAKTVAYAVAGIAQRDPKRLGKIIAEKRRLYGLADEAKLHQARRLVADEPKRMEAYRLEIEVISRLKRVYYFAKRIAKATLTNLTDDEAKELAES